MPFFGSKPAPAAPPPPPKELDTALIRKNMEDLMRKRNDCEVRMRDGYTRLNQYKQQYQTNPMLGGTAKIKAMEVF